MPLTIVMLLTLQLCLAGLAGTSSHLGYFIQGEHHIQAPNIFRLYLVLTCLVFFVEAYCERQDVQTTVLMATSVVSCYSIGLFSSLLIYRVFFHLLHRFPGPRLAKVSKLWNVVKASKSTNFRLMEDLHDRYGDFVRTGTKKSLCLPIYYPAVYMLTLVQIRSKWDIDLQAGGSTGTRRAGHEMHKGTICNLESPLPPRGTRTSIAKGVRYGNQHFALKVRRFKVTHQVFPTNGF